MCEEEKEMKIGFVGLGIMGKPMCKNLIKAGYSVICFSRSRPAMDEAAKAGAAAAGSISELAPQCRIIITMLPDSPDVRQVALGEGGIRDNAAPGTLLVDMSSIAPLASREIHDALAAKNIRMLDAPVSGGEPKAVNGTLSVMVGGDVKDLEEARPILDVLADSVTHVGPIGAGNIAKLANQAIVAVNIAVLAEALTLAKKAGADPERVFQAIRGGLAASAVMDAKAPMMLSHNTQPGFTLDLHIKDLANVQEAGHSLAAPMPLVALVMEMMQSLKTGGHGSADHSVLSRFYEELAGCRL
ncbi:2-hydroxy-3-oxopropionate reductase [Desulfosarcina sp. OttesenSCG-928-A07]|nr:2-hydroxy-3-oxopropionate reductase [Desulfosarcina sp. OttesenSCG-928-G17]MDL2328283.1 2-hydroxy-3-oxopropionate reductase [Desulfosarcina sp. OttesenSCG-928-A07]